MLFMPALKSVHWRMFAAMSAATSSSLALAAAVRLRRTTKLANTRAFVENMLVQRFCIISVARLVCLASSWTPVRLQASATIALAVLASRRSTGASTWRGVEVMLPFTSIVAVQEKRIGRSTGLVYVTVIAPVFSFFESEKSTQACSDDSIPNALNPPLSTPMPACETANMRADCWRGWTLPASASSLSRIAGMLPLWVPALARRTVPSGNVKPNDCCASPLT